MLESKYQVLTWCELCNCATDCRQEVLMMKKFTIKDCHKTAMNDTDLKRDEVTRRPEPGSDEAFLSKESKTIRMDQLSDDINIKTDTYEDHDKLHGRGVILTKRCEKEIEEPSAFLVYTEDPLFNDCQGEDILEMNSLSNEEIPNEYNGIKLEVLDPKLDDESSECVDKIIIFNSADDELDVYPGEAGSSTTDSSTFEDNLPFESHLEISAEAIPGEEGIPSNSNRLYLQISEDGRQLVKECPDTFPQLKLQGANERDFSCVLCGAHLTNESSLTAHSSTHRKGSLISCDHCHFSTPDQDKIKKHVKSHRNFKTKKAKNVFKCLQCEFSTGYERRIHVHVDKHFEQVYENCFECQTCHKMYKDHASLRKHKLCHAGVRPFVCAICGADFFLKTYLTLHMRYSHTEKPFACGYCPFKFAMKSSLTLHERTHTGEKPFKCSECVYRAVGSKTLLEHYRNKHSVNAPFRCSTCNKGFHTNSRFLKHTKTHIKNDFPQKSIKSIVNTDSVSINIIKS